MTATCKRGHPRTPENTRHGRCKLCQRDRARERYATDPEYRAKRGEWRKDRYRRNRERLRAADRERYARDPEYRAQRNAASTASYRKSKEDPDRWARKREYWRIYQEARRREKGIPPRNWRDSGLPGYGGRLPVEPFVEWLAQQKNWVALCTSEHEERALRRVFMEGQPWVSLDVVDRTLLAAGVPWMLDELYPLDDDMEVAA